MVVDACSRECRSSIYDFKEIEPTRRRRISIDCVDILSTYRPQRAELTNHQKLAGRQRSRLLHLSGSIAGASSSGGVAASGVAAERFQLGALATIVAAASVALVVTEAVFRPRRCVHSRNR